MVSNVEGDKPEASLRIRWPTTMRIYVGDRPAEEKGEVGDVEDRLPAPLVHQLAKGEWVDDGANICRWDNPRASYFLEQKQKSMKWLQECLEVTYTWAEPLVLDRQWINVVLVGCVEHNLTSSANVVCLRHVGACVTPRQKLLVQLWLASCLSPLL